MYQKIKQAIENLVVKNEVDREVHADCLYALKVSKDHGSQDEYLRKLFSHWLWNNRTPNDENEMSYVVALGRVEEHLYIQGIMKEDRRSSDTN